MTYTVRDLQTFDEMMSVHRLQQKIWGLDDPNLGLYPPVLNTAAKNGGVVLGAFDDESGDMVGFLFSFLGREKGGPLKLCSQIMGVLKGWRRHGIAEALKQTQRQRAIEQGLPLITWTFDPLEGPNAHLNLHKLRAVSRRYLRNVYGSDFGELNAGLPTDRLLVEWWVQGPPLDRPCEAKLEQAAPVFKTEGKGIERRIVESNLTLDAPLLQLEAPAEIRPVKSTNMTLARDWRMKLRAAFEAYFELNYLATDFVSTVDTVAGERRNRYLLQKSTPDLLADIGIHP